MPRKNLQDSSRTQRKRLWSQENMIEALKALSEGKMGVLKASKKFKVPKTTLHSLYSKTSTIGDFKEIVSLKMGRKPVLGNILEEELVKYILIMKSKGYRLTRQNIRQMAFYLAKRNGIAHPFNEENQAAGRDWLYSFMKRHKNILSVFEPTGTSSAINIDFDGESFDTLFESILKEYESIFSRDKLDISKNKSTGLSEINNEYLKVLTSNNTNNKNDEINDSIPMQQIMQVLEIKMEDEEKIETQDEIILPDLCEPVNDFSFSSLPTIHIKTNSELETKEAAVKNQFIEFVKILKQSYPAYDKMPDKIQSDFCKLDATQQVPSEKRYTNFWKFKCHRMPKSETSMNTYKTENTDNFVDNEKYMWKIESDYSFVHDLPNRQLYPPFIQHIIKVLEKFLNEPSMKLQLSSYEDKQKTKEESIKISMQANSKNEVIVIVVAHNDDINIKNALEKYLHKIRKSSWNVRSLYFKRIYLKNDWSKCETSLLYGVEELHDSIGGVRFKMSSKVKFPSHPGSVEILAKTLDDYLTPCLDTTLLYIGCRNGLTSLILSSRYKEVIGLDVSSEIKIAQKVCFYNNIGNVTFEKAEMRNVELFFEKMKHRNKVTAIVNNNVDCGQSTVMMKNLRQLTSLNQLVLVTPFTEESFPSILELIQPCGILGSRFIPLRSSIVDTMPGENRFEIVILMERDETFEHQPIIKQELTEKNNFEFINTFSSSSNDDEVFKSPNDNIIKETLRFTQSHTNA